MNISALSSMLNRTLSRNNRQRSLLLQCITFGHVQCAAKKRPPSLFSVYFNIIFFYRIFRDYSGHNLPLLVQILSSQLLLLRSNASKDDFFQMRRQINQTTTNFQAYFKHKIRLKCRKKYQLLVVSCLLVVENKNINY